ncbi:heterokaryon incompatibility protein-domain-containing protein [Rhexocercosporidium sp. MPI-PUGE-AT-0058]|nr:heterokaryon incompatibility protein-domain-containing protein [Rhexocercosporidium sp. MPI-PUGE-AT-0058]
MYATTQSHWQERTRPQAAAQGGCRGSTSTHLDLPTLIIIYRPNIHPLSLTVYLRRYIHKMDPQSRGSLCDLCQSISIETLDSPEGLAHSKLGRPVNKNNSCSMCHFLSRYIRSRAVLGIVRLFLEKDVFPGSVRLAFKNESGTIVSGFDCALMTDEGDPAVRAGVRVRRRPHHPSSPCAYDTAKSWIKECSMTHGCSSVSPGLDEKSMQTSPARLIDLQAFPGESEDVRIVAVEDLCMRYATLSYCWGDTMPRGSTTTLDNIQAREERLQTADLPQTLRDAIKITRGLDIRYLWIDAICIIQNSNEDWNVESAKMTSIYGNGLISIAVELNSNCLDSFLISKPEEQNLCFDHVFKISNTLSTGETSNLYVWHEAQCRCFIRYEITYAWETSLSSRGWTYQERFLAPRILHFIGAQILWGCREKYGVPLESGIELQNAGLLHQFHPTFSFIAKNVLYPKIQLSASRLLAHWYHSIIPEFCRRQLSHEDDKLPAIAGIAKVFHQRLAYTYIAGLWLEDIENGLCWRVDWQERMVNTKLSDFRAPTWAWPSVDGIIDWLILDKGSAVTYRVKVEDHHIQLTGTDSFGRTSGGWLQLNGFIGHGSLRGGMLVCQKSKIELGHPFLDARDNEIDLEGLHLTYLVLSVVPGYNSSFQALILRARGEGNGSSIGEFERIGILNADYMATIASLEWLEEFCEKTSIKLY